MVALTALSGTAQAGGFSAPPGRTGAPSRVAAPSSASTAPVIAASSNADDWRTARAVRALDQAVATLRANSVNGGYPGYIRVGTGLNYGKDLHQALSGTEIRTAYGGTPSFGMLFLEAYRQLGRPQYLTAARDVGRALAWTQNADGGWNLTSNTSGFVKGWTSAPRQAGITALDDDGSTQGCVSFLIELDKEINEAWLTQAVEAGLDVLMAAQTDQGGWEARYPSHGAKESLLYFNDGVTDTSIDALLDGYVQYGRPEYLAAAKRGADFIIRARLVGAAAPLWAEQYTHDLAPTWGRPWEAPEASIAAAKWCLDTLYKISDITRDPKYITPMIEVAQWIDAHQVAENRWPRYYDRQSGQPVYFDADGTAYDDWRDIPPEKIQPGARGRLDMRGIEMRFDVQWGDLRDRLDAIERVRVEGMAGFVPIPPVVHDTPDRQVRIVMNSKWRKVEPYVIEVERDGGWILRSSRGRFYSMAEFRTGMRQLVEFIQRDPQFPELRQRWSGGR